jgi:hypothetical protein
MKLSNRLARLGRSAAAEDARAGRERRDALLAFSESVISTSRFESSDALVCGLPSMGIPRHRTGASGRETVAKVNERFRWRDLLDFVSY